MKLFRNACFEIMFFLLYFTVLVPLSAAEKKIDVIFMHDVHSFLEQSAKIKTIIEAEKKTRPDTFVLDAGDFSMGTLYQTVFATEAAELRIFGAMGVDATTIGNHEFDYGTEALASMFLSALKTDSPLPRITICNIDWSNPNEDTALLKKTLGEYGCSDYLIIEKGGVRMAVIGVFGKDALFCAPSCKLTFLDPVSSIKKCVERIKKEESVDMIVCLSHCGTNEKASKSEDLILAQKVPELDFIISGHTHTVLQEPIVCNDTYIVSCGAYNEFLGSLSMTQKDNGRWSIDSGSYSVQKITDTVQQDTAIKQMLSKFKILADKEYFFQYGFSADLILTENKYDASTLETGGYAIGAGFRYSAEKYAGVKADAAVVPSGVMRCGYGKGNVTASLVYQSYALGIGKDKKSGYPLLAVYLSGKELKTVAEIDASVSTIMSTAHLALSGLVYEYNPLRPFLDRVTNVYLDKENGQRVAVEQDKLYCVLCDSYSGQMLNGVTKMTHGLVSIKPKNAEGTPLINFMDAVLYTKSGELKAWQAIAYMIRDKKELANYERTCSEVKIAVPTLNPTKYFAYPSLFACILYTGIVLLAVFIAIIICILFRRIKK